MSHQNRSLAVAAKMRSGAALVALVAGAATVIGSSSAVAQGDDDDRPTPSISVSGEGEVQAKADTVAINVGVVTEGETAQQALTANNQAMQQLFDVLDRQQIAEKDRQTTRFDVSPQYRQEQPGPRGPRGPQTDTPREPRIVGYQVTNEVRVKVREVSRLGSILDAVVSAGSNRIHGIQFSVEDEDRLKDEARQRAVKRAREKAELLAEAAGVSVGNVITIREEEFSRPMPQQRMMMMEASSAPIAEGEQTIAARVQVTFELK